MLPVLRHSSNKARQLMKLDHIDFSFTIEYVIQQNIQNQMESTIIVSYNFIEVTEIFADRCGFHVGKPSGTTYDITQDAPHVNV